METRKNIINKIKIKRKIVRYYENSTNYHEKINKYKNNKIKIRIKSK